MIEIWLRPLARPTARGDAAQLARELAVGARLAVRDLAQARPRRRSSNGVPCSDSGRSNSVRSPAKYSSSWRCDLGERAVVRAGVGVQAVAVGVELGQAVLVGLDVERADRAGEERVHACRVTLGVRRRRHGTVEGIHALE